MARSNRLLDAPPYPVDRALRRLGENLRTARLRRNLTIEEVAEKIGAGARAVVAAERGKPSTGIAVYMALLWAYGLLDAVADLADPTRDEVGHALALSREPSRARGASGGLDDDF